MRNMKIKYLSNSYALLFLLCFLLLTIQGSNMNHSHSAEALYPDTPELIVRFQQTISNTQRNSLYQEMSRLLINSIGIPVFEESTINREKILLLSIPPNTPVQNVVKLLKPLDGIRSIEVNDVYTLMQSATTVLNILNTCNLPTPLTGTPRHMMMISPNDPLFQCQWHLSNSNFPFNESYRYRFMDIRHGDLGSPMIRRNLRTSIALSMNITAVWSNVTDCRSVPVAVIDSGIDYTHEDLQENLWDGASCLDHNGDPLGDCIHGYDFVDEDKDPMSEINHGTSVAGVIGAVGNNNKGVSGVCWDASIMAIKVLSTESALTSNLVKAIDFARHNGAKIINLSVANFQFSSLFKEAIDRAQAADILVVAAAGNSRADFKSGRQCTFPCCYDNPNILCVAGGSIRGHITYSNRDTNPVRAERKVDLAAPGSNILTTWSSSLKETSHFNLDFEDSMGDLDWTLEHTKGAFRWNYLQCELAGSTRKFLSLAPDCTAAFSSSSKPNYAEDIESLIYKELDLSGISSPQAIEIGILGLFATLGGSENQLSLVHSTDKTNWTSSPIAKTLWKKIFRLKSCDGSSTCYVGFRFLGKTGQGQASIIITPDSSLQVSIYESRPTAIRNEYNFLAGTSFAAPLVAGSAALLRSYNPDFNFQHTIDAFLKSRSPIEVLLTTSSFGRRSWSENTKSGRSIDLWESLRYIGPVESVVVTEIE